ncbi:hypothetical protein ABZ297_06565 [Nonomuraea sp. NPDC005983]
MLLKQRVLPGVAGAALRRSRLDEHRHHLLVTVACFNAVSLVNAARQ